jgi:hypothetical protein
VRVIEAESAHIGAGPEIGPTDPTGAAAAVITRSSIAWFVEIATSLSQLAGLVVTTDKGQAT